MQDFKKWITGELQRQNGNCSRAENAVDFRERSRSQLYTRSEYVFDILASRFSDVLFTGRIPHKSGFLLLGPRGRCHSGLVFEDAAEVPGIFISDSGCGCLDIDIRVLEQDFFCPGYPEVSKVLERRCPVLFII